MTRLSKHILLGIVTAMLFVGGHAQAQQKAVPTATKIQPDYSSEIKVIQTKLDEINSKITESQKASVERDDLGNLKVEIGNSKQAFYDSQINWLNAFIAAFTLILALFSITAACVGFWGFRSFKEFRSEINSRIAEEVSKQYDTTVKSIYSKEFESIREKISAELVEMNKKIDNIEISKKTGVPVNTPNNTPTTENAFDEPTQ